MRRGKEIDEREGERRDENFVKKKERKLKRVRIKRG